MTVRSLNVDGNSPTKKYQINMEFGVYTWFGMANLNMDRNGQIDALIIRSYEGNVSLTWNLVYILSLG